MKKTKSLEKEIIKVMNHYHFDPYTKQIYIQNCAGAIVKVVMEIIGDNEVNNAMQGSKAALEIMLKNDLRQEIRDRILGK